MIISAGSTDKSVVLRIVDSTDGTPEQAVTSATAGLALWYWREGAAALAALTESDLATLDAAHADGGMLHIDDGYYRVDIPDAAFATGADFVLIGGAATGMVVIGETCQLMAVPADVTAGNALPDSYSADGAQPTLAQAILEIRQFLFERAVSGTTVTVKKPNGSSSAMTFTLDNNASPTSITRAS